MRAFLLGITLAGTLLSSAAESNAQSVIVDIGPAFPTGPYSGLFVDRNNPQRIAIGTMDGHIAWSEDAGATVTEARVISPRNYDAMAVRSGARAEFGGGQPDDPQQASSSPQAPGDDSNLTLGNEEHPREVAPPAPAERPVRMFIRSLTSGKGIVRWQYWMAIAAPLTDIGAIYLPAKGGRLLAAGSAGILVSDDKGGSWTRTLGAPGTMPREKVDLVGLAVASSPADPSFVLASTTEGVFLSRDGGMNFIPHVDSAIREEMIFEFVWDTQDPTLVLAVGPDTILQSTDGGQHFELAHVDDNEINAVAAAEEGVYIATNAGLTLMGPNGAEPLIAGKSVISVVPWGNGQALALMTDELVLVDASGAQMRIMHTTDTDQFFKLDGAPGLAYLLSSNALFRIGIPVDRIKPKNIPVMALSSSATQQAMLNHLGIGTPNDTRIHQRWYAHLLPTVDFNFVAHNHRDDYTTIDYTLPQLDFRYAEADNGFNVDFSIMANWDLSQFVFGDTNISNPELFIESTLAANRERLLMEVRTQYREAAMLAHRLKHPPADPHMALLWRMRLEERASYLEHVTGQEVVKTKPSENN